MWKGPLSELEEEHDLQGKVKFVLYSDPNGKWRIQGVPPKEGSFELRVPLKKEWCGKRDKELNELAGITDGTFVHANGFIGGADSQA